MPSDHRSAAVAFSALLLLIATLSAPVQVNAEQVDASGQVVVDQEAELQARRQKMIEDCKANRGIDCETEVDIELEAEQMGGGGGSVGYPVRPVRPVVPRPRPRPSN